MKPALKSLCLLGICSATVLLFSFTAHAQPSGFYVKADAGGNIPQDIDLKEFFGTDVSGAKLKLDPGFRAGVGAGYQFNEWFAAEAEVGFFANNIDSITAPSPSTVHNAYFYNAPFLVNARFQYPSRCPFTPYIGAGIGGSAAGFDADRIDIGNVHLSGSDSDVVFAWQAFAGVRYELNDRMGVGVEYRYFYAGSPTWHADFSVNTLTDRMTFGASHTHAFSLTFNFRF